MKSLNNIVLDDGYRLGLGAFETISVKNGKGILLSYHMERLKKALDILGIQMAPNFDKKMSCQIRQMPELKDVLRVSISQDNTVWETHKNPYTEEDYTRGFSLMVSSVRRNETSPMTRIKSLNQGDNILQRRLALRSGFDEAVFLNSKSEITEGTVSNIFFVADNRLYTPDSNCGLLAGTIRRWLIEKFDVKEMHFQLGDLASFQEMFITNSLIGVMPVSQLGSLIFRERKVTNELMDIYRNIDPFEPYV